MRNSRNRDERAAGGLPPHSFIFSVAFYYSSFTCPRVQFSLLLARAEPVGPAGFCSRRGSLGKAGAHQEEKGLPTRSRRGREFLSRPKTCRYFLFLMVYVARLILPARGIMHAELNPRGTEDVAPEMNWVPVTFKSPGQRPAAAPKNFIRL